MPQPPSSPNLLRLGTRGSLLAQTQSRLVAGMLEAAHPGLRVELQVIRTSGDRIQDRPLHEAGGKGLFTKELEQALLDKSIDFAVHSFKDVPVTMPLVEQENLLIAAVPAREDPRDVAIMRDPSQGAMPRRAVVGTTSLRRRCQILEITPDARVEPLRGNIDTRIQKLRDGKYDVIILAMAGLKRAGLFDPSFMRPLEPESMLPAPGQGALALQCRRDDERTVALLSRLNDLLSAVCVQLERAIVSALNGDCHSPIAALAMVDGSQIRLRAAIGAREGRPPVVRAEASAPVSEPHRAVDEVIDSLQRQGAQSLLHGPDQPH